MDRSQAAEASLRITPALRNPALAPRRQPVLSRPKVLLCDLDGTLIDTMPILADIATDVLSEVYGLPRSLGRELYLSTCGLPFIRQLDAICPGDARNPRASDIFEGRKPASCRSVRMPGDTRRTLSALQEAGTRIVVSSNNGVENVEAFARDSGFAFDLVLGYGNGLFKGRPHIERAQAQFGVRRSEMLFAGDSLHDGEIAGNQQLPFVGVVGTFSK